jgi:DNA-binding SARP family transcriptional activator
MARNNLRQTLYRLRQTISDHKCSVPHLLVSTREIRFNPAGDYWLDVDQFRMAVNACQAHHHRGELPCKACVCHLEVAAALYKGDFLRGFSLPDSPPFEWWQLTRQETYHSQALCMLEWLGAYYQARQNYQRAAECALLEIELEPWRESAHRRAMRALAMSGQRRAALQHFDMCQRMLSQELGTEPSKPTMRIFEQIRHGTLQDEG